MIFHPKQFEPVAVMTNRIMPPVVLSKTLTDLKKEATNLNSEEKGPRSIVLN